MPYKMNTMNFHYTGFTSCKIAENYQRMLKIMKITRNNSLKQSKEPIVRPKVYLYNMEAIREKLNRKNTI